MKNREIKPRFVLDDAGAHIAISVTVAGIVVQKMVAGMSFSVHPAGDWVKVSLPPGGDIDRLAQIVHTAETGASVPVTDENAGEPGSLVRDDPDDGSSYILREGADGVWVRIKNIDTHLHLTDEGVVADLYPAHQPDLTPVASAYAFFAECDDEQS